MNPIDWLLAIPKFFIFLLLGIFVVGSLNAIIYFDFLTLIVIGIIIFLIYNSNKK